MGKVVRLPLGCSGDCLDLNFFGGQSSVLACQCLRRVDLHSFLVDAPVSVALK